MTLAAWYLEELARRGLVLRYRGVVVTADTDIAEDDLNDMRQRLPEPPGRR